MREVVTENNENTAEPAAAEENARIETEYEWIIFEGFKYDKSNKFAK